MRGDMRPVPPDSPATTYSCQFQIGGIAVRMNGENSADVTLVRSLEPFRAKAGISDISIHIERVTDLPTVSKRPLFDSGTTWRLYEDDAEFQFDFLAAVLGDRPFKRLFVDKKLRRANLQISEECLSILGRSVEPLGYPLDELLIMHRLTQEKAIELHGSGIVRANGVANLFVGHSGAGKSTTTRLWTDVEDVEVLSDDRIIVRRDEQQQIPRFARNDNGNENSSCRNDRKMRMYGTPWHGEAMFASPNSAPLTRIFVLEHGHSNIITRLSPSQAVAELFARSFVPFHRHEYVDSALVFLEELVDSVPVYRYSFEPDHRAVDKIRHFND